MLNCSQQYCLTFPVLAAVNASVVELVENATFSVTYGTSHREDMIGIWTSGRGFFKIYIVERCSFVEICIFKDIFKGIFKVYRMYDCYAKIDLNGKVIAIKINKIEDLIGDLCYC